VALALGVVQLARQRAAAAEAARAAGLPPVALAAAGGGVAAPLPGAAMPSLHLVGGTSAAAEGGDTLPDADCRVAERHRWILRRWRAVHAELGPAWRRRAPRHPASRAHRPRPVMS